MSLGSPLDGLPPLCPPEMPPVEIDSDSSDSGAVGMTEGDRVVDAEKLKEEGTLLFRGGKYSEARGKYETAIKRVRGIDQEVMKEMLISLLSNVSLMSLKLKDHEAVIKNCLEINSLTDEKNTKALYRLSLAYIETNNFTGARDCSLKLYRLSPTSEFRAIYDKAAARVNAHKESQRAKMRNMFSESLYADKEQEMQRRLKEEEQLDNKLRKDWEEQIGDEEKETFDEWKAKKKKERDEATRKADDAKKKKAMDDSNPLKKRKAKQQVESEDVEYTAEELKILNETKSKGYCYFKDSSLTPEEVANKSKTQRNAPCKLDEEKPKAVATATVGPSSWNAAGTSYEEKNMISWTKQLLPAILERKFSEVSETDCSICFVKAKFADASLAQTSVIRGTQRYLYDLDLEVEYRVTDKVGKVSTGTFHSHPGNVTTEDWESEVTHVSRQGQISSDLRKKLVTDVLSSSVKEFEEKFKSLIN